MTIPPAPMKDKWKIEKISDFSQDEALSSGDIDGDGRLDLLLGTVWLRNSPDGWTRFTIDPSRTNPDRNRLADINRDGKLDAVVGFEAISKAGEVIWYEQGPIATQPWIPHLIGTVIGPMSLDVADFDGDGDLDVVAWLTLFGDKDGKGGGWKYMDGLHENIAQYTHSGSKPCNMAASGEFVVGISFEYRANANKAKGAPIDLIFPKEGLGWDLEAFAIHKGTKKLDAAKKLADWASSKDAMLLYGKNFAITAQPGVAAPLANVPKDYEARLVKLDFNYAAEQRERILAEWTKRYNGKTEKR